MRTRDEIYNRLCEEYLSHESISKLAKQYWIEEGCPERQALQHWWRAGLVLATTAYIDAGIIDKLQYIQGYQ